MQEAVEQRELASKQLAELMQEYLTIKKVEREVNGSLWTIEPFPTIFLQNVFAELHPIVRKRVYALKNLQLETINVEAEFHREVYELEQNYQMKHDAIFKKRSDIVNGNYQPTDDECKLPGIDMNLDEPTEGQDTPNGVPNFWLTLMKNVKELNNIIQEDDEKVLKHLVDVRAFSKSTPNLSFQLEFHFEPNDFFQNTVLTKTYLMKCSPDEEDPFSFEGPEIYRSIGCEIMWNAGKNVVEQAVNGNPTSRLFKTESFFNFFNPPELKPGTSEENEEIEVSLKNVFRRLSIFRQFSFLPRRIWRLISKSVTTWKNVSFLVLSCSLPAR